MLMTRTMAMLALLLAALLLAALLALTIHADPREVETAEYAEEFGDEIEVGNARNGVMDQRVEFELEHVVGEQSFTPRGKVEIVWTSASSKPKVTFAGLPTLSSSEIQHLESVLKKNGLYTVRARSDPLDASSPYVTTSIPMCILAATRMREDFAFHLSDDGKLLAIEYLSSYLSPSVCAEYLNRDLKSVKMSAFGSALKAQNGPSPPILIASKKERAPKGVKPIKSDDEPAAEENQSFFRRYWYLIVPIVVFSLFGSDPAPAAGGAGGAPAAASGGPRRR